MTTFNNLSIPIFNKHRKILVCLFLIVTTLAVYWQVHSYEFVNYDDDYYVYKNDHVQGGLTSENIIWAFTDGTRISNYWIPLTWISHILDFQLYHMNAGGHHLTSLLFHIANTLILFLVFNKMTGHLWRSAFVAALFALHPQHVESVAWIAERKDVLSTFFWMLTMLVYARYAERPGLNRYFWVLLFFVLGLMAKPMLVTLPFVLLLMDYWPLGRLQLGQAISSDGIKTNKSAAALLIGEKIPLLALTIIASIAAYITQREGGVVPAMDFDLIKIQTANALVSYVSYIAKMVWPSRLAAFYPQPENLPFWKVIGAGTLLVSLSVLVVRWGRKFPYLPVGWFWYFGTLVPVIGLVKISVFGMADRYTYVPLIGIFIVIAWGISDLVPQWKYKKIGFASAAVVVLSILMTLTWKQIGYWENSITLFEHTLKETSNNWLAHYNLGQALDEQSRTEEAIDHYLQALRIKPDFAGAHNNLGIDLKNEGRTDEALDHYLKALRIKPDYAEAHYNLANALFSQSRIDEAMNHYLQALRIKPDYAEVHNNLGIALQNEGRTDEAIDHYLEALRIKPDYKRAQYNLQEALALSREINGNMDKVENALKSKPNDPFLNYVLGNMNRINGKLDKAVDYYQKALSFQPEFIDAMYQLAKLFITRMEYEKALSLYQKMIAILPNHPALYYNIACIYARQGKPENTISWLKKAVENGFDDWNHIKTDIDLKNIRGSSYYKEFIKGH